MKRYLHLIASICILCVTALWLVWIEPRMLSIPADFASTAHVESFDNFYNTTTGQFNGEQESATTFAYDTINRVGSIQTIENSIDVRTLSGDPIFIVTRTYTIDPISGEHIASGVEHPRSGYLFAPRMKGLPAQVPDKSPFTYWHVNYDAPALMEYQDAESLAGLDVYRYQAHFVSDQTKELTGFLPTVGSTTGIMLNVSLQLWVEPYTGRIIQYRDDTEALYYDLATGARLYPWNKFHNQTASDSVAAQAKNVVLLKERYVLLQYGVTGTLIVLAILVVLSTYVRRLSRLFFASERRREALPWYAASGVIVLSLLAASFAASISSQRAIADFMNESSQVSGVVRDSLETVAKLLRTGRGFVEREDITYDDWRAFTSKLNLTKAYPGVQGFGFAQVVRAGDVASYLAVMRKNNGQGFSIDPSPDRDLMVPVTFLEPLDARNKRAIGFDMWSESNRQAAMAYARDANDVGISGKVILKQENGVDEQAGFLMYEPVYRPFSGVASIADRRESIYAYVYSAFRVKDFMVALFSKRPTVLGVEIFDSASPDNLDEAQLLYRSETVPLNPVYTRVETVTMYNRSWTIRYTAGSEYEANVVADAFPYVIVLAGLLLALGAFSLVRMLSSRQAEAQALAEKMTQDLKESRDKLADASKELQDKLSETERLNKIMIDRELRMVELKKEIADLKHHD